MFLLSQNDENQSENGSKNSKIRLRARPPAEPQKKMLQTKKLRSKSWKTRVFFTFRLPIWTGAFTNRCLPYCFLQCFLKASVTTYQKTGGFGRKIPPPPGKPVTFLRVPSRRSRPSTFGAGGFWDIGTDSMREVHIWRTAFNVHRVTPSLPSRCANFFLIWEVIKGPRLGFLSMFWTCTPKCGKKCRSLAWP